MEVYTKTIQVEASHLDDLNHVNNVVFLQWVQDIAKEHWKRNTTDEINQKYIWVVRTHHIEYKKQVFLKDELTVKTFVPSYKGPFSERVVQFYRNEELVVEARSNWCLLRSENQQPIRVPEELKKLF